MRMVLYLILITWSIDSYSNVFFMLAPYLARKGFPSAEIGFLVGAFYAATTLVRPIGGTLVEAIGVRRTLIISAVVCFVVAIFNFVAVSFWELFLIRLVMGFAFGIFIVAITAYQSLLISEEDRGGDFALIAIGPLACLFTVTPLADWLLAHDFLNTLLTLPLCAALLCLYLSFRLPPLPNGAGVGEDEEWSGWREFYRQTPFWRTVISCLLFGLCDASIVYLPSLLLSMKLVPTYFFLSHALAALVMRIWGREFFNRYQRYFFAGPSLLIMAIFLYLTIHVSDNFCLALAGVGYGIGMGYGFPAHIALVGDLFPPRMRTKSSALVYFCYDFSWFLLPVTIGLLTPLIGEVNAFEALAVLSMFSGVAITIMWSCYGRKTVGADVCFK